MFLKPWRFFLVVGTLTCCTALAAAQDGDHDRDDASPGFGLLSVAQGQILRVNLTDARPFDPGSTAAAMEVALLGADGQIINAGDGTPLRFVRTTLPGQTASVDFDASLVPGTDRGAVPVRPFIAAACPNGCNRDSLPTESFQSLELMEKASGRTIIAINPGTAFAILQGPGSIPPGPPIRSAFAAFSVIAGQTIRFNIVNIPPGPPIVPPDLACTHDQPAQVQVSFVDAEGNNIQVIEGTIVINDVTLTLVGPLQATLTVPACASASLDIDAASIPGTADGNVPIRPVIAAACPNGCNRRWLPTIELVDSATKRTTALIMPASHQER